MRIAQTGNGGRRLVAATAVWMTCFASVGGEEPATAFLNALRDRGYHDTALEYLDRMSASPLAPIEFREVIAFERAVTEIANAHNERDLDVRSRKLDEAQKNLEEFARQHAGHALVPVAQRQFGNLLVERGRIRIEQSKTGNRAAMLKEAAEFYEQAYAVFARSCEELKAKLSRIKPVLDPKTEASIIRVRDELRKEYLEAQLLAAAVLEEQSDTAGDGTASQKEMLEKAAAEYGAIYEKYRTRLAGLYARLYEGRCKQKLGMLDDALSYYVHDLLAQPSQPDEFRVLKTQTLLLAMQCWIDPSQQKYAEAVNRCTNWLDGIRPNEARDADWLRLRLLLARAHAGYAKQLEETKPGDAQINRSLEEAKKLARLVSRMPGETQDEARELLAALPGGVAVDTKKPEPRTFDEAKTAGREALGAMQSAEFLLANTPERLKIEKDAAVRAQLEKSLDEAQQTLAESRALARANFELALGMANADTDVEDVNLVRYFLCYLYFTEGEYYDSAVLGEFVARRHPDSSAARQSGKIAMAAYLQLYGDSASEDKEFESRRVAGVAQYIADTWRGAPEAVEALNTLIPFMINEGRLDEAQSALEAIPEDSPHRGAAELTTGRAMWSNYIRDMNEWTRQAAEPDAASDPAMIARRDELVKLRDAARGILEAGVARIAPESLDETAVTAMLSLAQIYVESDLARRAIDILEKEDVGLSALARQQHPAATNELVVQEIHKTALRAYIGALTKARDSDETDQLLNQAKQAIQSLKQTVASSPEAQKGLVAVYFGMARDLERQIQMINAPEEKRLLSEGFSTFLDEVAQESDELNILNWVAEAYSSLGNGFQSSKDVELARRYFSRAAETYTGILDRGRKQPAFLSKQLELQVNVRLARALREMGDYARSIEAFSKVLRENNMMVDVQMEAARTYQQWAMEPGQEKYFDNAIRGGELNKGTRQNTIWGWILIARRTGHDQRFRDTFYESRLNLAVSHYQFARRQKGAEREKYLNYAKNDIITTHKAYPDLGGDAWRSRFDGLLRDVQKALNESPVGLPKG